jgi:hypothetical protein
MQKIDWDCVIKKDVNNIYCVGSLTEQKVIFYDAFS